MTVAKKKREMSFETRAYLAELRREKRGRSSRQLAQRAHDEAVKDAADWNAANQVGAVVELTRDDGSVITTQTRSPAWVLSSGDAVVQVVGMSGGYLLSRVRAVGDAR